MTDNRKHNDESAQRPPETVNGRCTREGRGEALARSKEWAWRGMLAQEFGPTDPKICHDGP